MNLEELFNETSKRSQMIRECSDDLFSLAQGARAIGLTQLAEDLYRLSDQVRTNTNKIECQLGMYLHEQFTASQQAVGKTLNALSKG